MPCFFSFRDAFRSSHSKRSLNTRAEDTSVFRRSRPGKIGYTGAHPVKVKFIYNPAAGRGRAARHHAEAERCLRELGAEVDAHASSSPADMTRAAAEASLG